MGGKMGERVGGRCKGKTETGIFRMRSHSENVPAWTGRRRQLSGDEVVNCAVVADLGPLAGADSGSSLKIDDSHEMVREQGEQA